MPRAEHHADVIVVGLGPAGACAAAAAARAGCRVLGFDRRQVAGLPVQCAELVPGLAAPPVAGGGGWRVQAVSAMATRVAWQPAERTDPFPGYIVDRARLDQALVAAARTAGAECHFASAVRVQGSGTIELANGRRVTAPVLIGCDGPRSRVAGLVDPAAQPLVAARQVTVPLTRASRDTDIFLSAAYGGGYGWLFPRGDEAHVGIGVAAAARARLPALLGALTARLARDGRIGETVLRSTGGYIPVGGPRPSALASDDHLVVLAGDAAGLTNPVTGAGIHAALESGELAGAAAAAWLAGDTSAAATYSEELDAVFGPSLRHALGRRRELLAGVPATAALRRAWIAYPEYWQRPRTRHAEAA